MAGGNIETDPLKLANSCENFMRGVKQMYENHPNEGDMWFFELFHHLNDCALTLRTLVIKDAIERERSPAAQTAPSTHD